MADDRTYIRVHDGLDEHPKVEGLSDAAFRLLLTSWFYCSRNRTDGRIKDGAWKRRGTSRARRELIDAGLAEQHDGYVEMHDYLEHQRSAEEIRLLKETRGDTGSFGNHVRWHVVRRKPKQDCEHCFPPEADESGEAPSDRKPIANGIANAIAKPSQTDRKPIASTEAEAEAEVTEMSFGGASHVSSGSPTTPPRFPDRCLAHADAAVPGNCGDCADTRKARQAAAARPVLSLVADSFERPAWCGACDEFTRQLDTPVGVIRCPECHPLAQEATA